MTASEKIQKLQNLYGWRALNANTTGKGKPSGKWWVTWDNERGPEMFNSYQAFHAYLNDKLGSERYEWRSNK